MIYSAKKAWVIDRTGKKLFTKKMKKNLAITGSSVDDVFTLYVYILNGSVFQHGLVPLYDGRRWGLPMKRANGCWNRYLMIWIL